MKNNYVVPVGKVGMGKSSIMNALAGSALFQEGRTITSVT